MLNLKQDQFQLSPQFTGVVALGRTKGGKRQGASELVAIDAPWIGAWLAAYLTLLKPGEPLLRGAAFHFRQFFKRALTALQIEHPASKPYFLRRRVVTRDWQSAGNMARTFERSRLSDIRFGRVYLIVCATALANMATTQMAASLLSHFGRLVMRS
jgi:hypothetical protein